MKKLLIALITILGFTDWAEAQATLPTTRIHWIGSAWMNFHGIASQCSESLQDRAGFGKIEHNHDRVWPLHALMDGGKRKMQLYSKERTLEQLIADMATRQFDILVATIQLEMIAEEENDASFEKTITFLLDQCRRNGSARLYLAPYGNDFGDKCQRGMACLIPFAKKHHATIIPWWGAMKQVAAERPQQPLFDAKVKGHPGLGSVYINVCTFFAAVTATDPAKASLPLQHRDWDQDPAPAVPISPEDAAYFQKVAWDVFQAVKP